MRPHRPPALAARILGWLLAEPDRDVHLSELAELYAMRAESDVGAARRWYWRQVVASGVRMARRPAQVVGVRGASQQLRQTVRALRRAPAFTVTASATLALGIGATVAVFSVVNGILLQALPYPDADRLVVIYTHSPPHRFNFSVADYLTLEARQTVLEDLGARQLRRLTYNADGVAERVLANYVTPSFLTTLRIEPLLGRGFTPEEGRPGGPRVVILSHPFWQTHLGSDPTVLGRSVRLDGAPYEIVGVMPPRPGPLETASADLWPVLQMEPPPRKGPFFWRVVARLKPGVSLEAANQELNRLNREMFAEWADSYADQRATWVAVPAMEWIVGDTRTAILVLFGGAMFVLLIAATNVANLVVSRSTVRARELALRSALGASRSRLAGLQIMEAMVVSAIGGAAGVGLAHVGVRVLTGMAPTALPRVQEIGVSVTVLAFAVGTTLVAGLLLGLAPGLGGGGPLASGSLHSGTRGASTGGTSRLRRALVAAQFAVALPLLVGAGLLVGSFARLLDVDPGFDPDRILSFQLALPPARYQELAQVNGFWDGLTRDLAALPGVEAVGLNSERPPDDLGNFNNFALAIRRTPAGESDPAAAWLDADHGFFETLEVPLVAGRLYDPSEDVFGELVVDQQWVRKHVPAGVDPIGLRLVSGSCTAQAEPEPPCGWQTVVGVVGSVKYMGLDQEDDDGAVYTNHRSREARTLYVYLGGEGASPALLPQVREIVARMDPELAVSDVAGGDELITASVARPRYLMTLFGVFALIAASLAAIGIYGVMSYFVSQHTRDIGIRVALGGRSSEVVALVVRRGMGLAVLGAVVGVGAAYLLSRFLEDLLFGVKATDPVTFAVVAGGLLLVAALACSIPAQRATRVDPVVALRMD